MLTSKTLLWLVAGCMFVVMLYIVGHLNFGNTSLCVWQESNKNANFELLQLERVQQNLSQVDQKLTKEFKFFPTKFVNIRAAYIDDRPRDGHKNATVLLANILKDITDHKFIVGCQIGNINATDFKVKVIGETPLWRAYPSYDKIDHEEVLIDCYDVPFQNGDQAFLYYKTSKNSEIQKATSERNVQRPDPYVKPTSPKGLEYNFTVVTCTKIFGGNAPWFVEWIKYQKHIGVDHVHLSVDNYFFIELSKERMDFVVEEMKTGFLSVEPWVLWLANGREVWYHNQGLILEDCGYRFRGTYDFMLVSDTDDFFVPRIPEHKTVHFYINKYFKPDIGSCKLKWIEYFPDEYLKPDNLPKLQDGNVTSLLTNFTHNVQGNPKSIHRTTALVDTATHYAFSMIDHFQGSRFQVQDAYFAHIRKNRKSSFHKVLVYAPP